MLFRVTQMSTKSEPSNTSGSAGAIREAGGAFGKLGAAKEAEYFYKKVMSYSLRSVYFTIVFLLNSKLSNCKI